MTTHHIDAQAVLWFMANGWSVMHHPAQDCLTEKANRMHAWSCARTEMPYCISKSDALRRWSGPTPEDAIASSLKDLGTEYKKFRTMVVPPASPGSIRTVGSTVYALNDRGTNRWTAHVQPGNDDNGKRISDEECEEVARHLAWAGNAPKAST